eukprot:22920_2
MRRRTGAAGALSKPWEVPFERNFWKEPPAPAMGWRQSIAGEPNLTALKAVRKSLGMVVKGDCPPPISEVDDPALDPLFGQFFSDMGFREPSRVQRQCWPAALTGADVLGIAP